MPAITITDLNNAKTDVDHIADLANSQNLTAIDRLGTEKKTLAGVLASIGYEAPVTYAGGISFTASDATKTVDESGVIYAPFPSALPFTTSGTFVGDDDARFYPIQFSISDTPQKVDDITGLLSEGTYNNEIRIPIGYHPASDKGGGPFYWDASLARSNHNGGTIISPTCTWDGTQADLADFLDGTNETSGGSNGCWVRVFNGKVNVKWFGAVGDWDGSSGADDTAAIQSAMDYVDSVRGNYALKTFEDFTVSGFPDSPANGHQPIIFFPSGVYKLSDQLTYRNYHHFEGEGSIIYQDDNTKNIFYSENIYFNRWHNLKFIGGAKHIVAKNTLGTGLEGVMAEIDYCDFSVSSDFCLEMLAGPTSGGEQLLVKNSRFFNFAQALKSTFDLVNIETCWIENRASYQPADSAWFDVTRINLTNCMMVPYGDYNINGNTMRYIDTSLSAVITGCRFGAEGNGAMPLVYCFADASADTTYPYQNSGGNCVIANNHMTYSGGSNRTDTGLIVLKDGIFRNIKISGNSGGADGPFIRTDLMNGTTFSTYMSGLTGNPDRLSIWVANNNKWADTLTDSANSTSLLEPYTVYEQLEEGYTRTIIEKLGKAGTWSPAYSSDSGYTAITAIDSSEVKYNKVGDVVTMTGRFTTDSTETNLAAGDYVSVTGIPVTPVDVTAAVNLQTIGDFTIYSSLGSNNMAAGSVLYNVSNDETVFFIQTVNGTVAASSEHSFSISYIADTFV